MNKILFLNGSNFGEAYIATEILGENLGDMEGNNLMELMRY